MGKFFSFLKMDKKNVQNRNVKILLTEKNLQDHIEKIWSEFKPEIFYLLLYFFLKKT